MAAGSAVGKAEGFDETGKTDVEVEVSGEACGRNIDDIGGLVGEGGIDNGDAVSDSVEPEQRILSTHKPRSMELRVPHKKGST